MIGGSDKQIFGRGAGRLHSRGRWRLGDNFVMRRRCLMRYQMAAWPKKPRADNGQQQADQNPKCRARTHNLIKNVNGLSDIRPV
jgi:hypothetical protein